MASGVRAAWFEYTQGTWKNKSTLRAYLQSMAIDEATQNKVCESGDRFKRGEEVIERNYIPPIWTLGFNMTIWVKAAMHLLGHRIIPAILKLAEAVFLDHKLGQEFKRFTNSYLDDISFFRLDWCKVK